MKTYDVYRMDYVKRYRVPLGEIVERRNRKRPDNFIGLLKVARKIYGRGPNYDMGIVLDKCVLEESGQNSET